jgi:hypothetical protein
MHKQTIILIAVLAVVTMILIYLAVINQNILKTNTTKAVPTQAPVQKTAKVYFNPSTISATTGTIESADIMVSSDTPVAGVQAEMQYDPKAITNVKITPDVDSTAFFGSDSTILFNDVTATTGRISYAIAISANGTGKSGSGKIGTITFTKALGATTSTQIKFLDKTLVSQLNVTESVLKDTMPLTITFSNINAQPPVRAVSPQLSPAQ